MNDVSYLLDSMHFNETWKSFWIIVTYDALSIHIFMIWQKISTYKKNQIEKYHQQLDLNAIWTLNVYVSSTKIENFYYLVDFQIICQFVGYPLKKFLLLFCSSEKWCTIFASTTYYTLYVWDSECTLIQSSNSIFRCDLKLSSQVVLATNRIKFVNVVSANVSFSRLRFPD